jgi:hypothetical protein
LPLSSVASVTSSSSSEVGIGRASVTIGIPSNVSLLDTRPSLSKPSSTNTTVYTFARPLDYLTSNNKQQSKPKPKQQKHISREEQEMINALMLDPLFLPPSTQYSSQSSTKKKKKQDIEQQHQQQQHPFTHENVKVGRDAVLIHSRRGHRGDQYIPSIGKIQYEHEHPII